MRPSKQVAVFAIAAAVLAVLLYAPVFHSQFVYDDVTLIAKNPKLNQAGSTLDYFRTATLFGDDFGGGTSSYYRPITWLSFGLDKWLYGGRSAGFHFTNLLLHWLNGVLAFGLLLRLGCKSKLASAAVLLWLALPINTEAVAWISARSYSLMFCFVLLALHALSRYLSEESWWNLVLFYLCALAAVLSHETGLLLLPLALVLFVWRRPRLRVWTWVVLAALVADAAYFLARSVASGSPPGLRVMPLGSGLYFAKYLSWMLLPLRMSMERYTDTPSGALSGWGVFWAIVILGLLGVTYRVRNKAPEVALALLWMFISLLPLCGFVFIYQGMAERYLYIPALGVCFVVAALAMRAPERIRNPVVALIVMWAVWGAWRTYARASDWRNERDLFASSLEATPRSWVLWLNLGNTYLATRELPEAAQDYQRALELHPRAVKALDNLATVRLMQGDPAQAEKEYRRAIAIEPNRSDSYSDLAVVVFDEGRIGEAEQLLSKAIQLDAANATAYFDLGVLYAHSGRPKQAAAMYRLALALNPDYTDAQRGLELLDSSSK